MNMGHDLEELLAKVVILAGGLTAFILLLIFVIVPLFKGVGTGIGYAFRGIGWFFVHVFDFIGGTLGDIVRFIGALLAMAVLIPLIPLNVLIGRWSASAHFAEGVKRECQVAAACVYRAAIRRPLKLVLLDGLLEGVEQRVPEAVYGSPGSDKPGHRTGQFDGYTILGSLRAGGSGAKLYVAEPTAEKSRKFRGMPNRVVIKSFALTEGSSLPQIVRESRALECAKQLGHVFDHGMDEHRFFYVMPYHPGDHLGIITRQLHGETGGRGLDQGRLGRVMSYTHDLLATLSSYHRGGLWHKDVKPENVIVHDGRAHLVDLGLVTPLRSAMTLTTHGTEYFRDPEMVRQALRGVKVHQVDGAKFDIYAAGAVLYFMIENTFPAHGGLSRFVAPSPEALRWIVRRAMTEYNQRYATAEEMLADLEYVARASNAFAVKPMDLPSMRGATPSMQADAGQAQFRPAADAVAAGPAVAAAAAYTVSAGSARPKLNVTNWWTGAYEVDGAGSGSPSMSGAGGGNDAARDFRRQAQAFRQQAQEMARQARIGAMNTRQAAREQIKAARARAREIRCNAKARRGGSSCSRTRGARFAAVFTMFTIFAMVLIPTMRLARSRTGQSMQPASVIVDAAPKAAPQRMIIVTDPALTPSDELRKYISGLLSSRDYRSYEVVADDATASALSPMMASWVSNQSGPADPVVEDLMEKANVYGVLYVAGGGVKAGKPRFSKLFVHSTREGARDRRGEPASTLPPVMTPPASGLAYLLINDHPARIDPRVAAKIDQLTRTWREAGWKIDVNDEVEAKSRGLLPPGPLDPAARLSPALRQVLTDANLGGILRIDARPGDGPPENRIAVSRIDVETLAAPEAPAPPQPPALPAAEIELKDVPDAAATQPAASVGIAGR